ncbi:hypothetical protein OG555_20520 [Kribbella sp. NBC_01484]|uniref:hypothetical protein n=1 Tax=Kribbella sp. NBC_01484 TaxID=2903579 RepID=UPI002E3645EA|nr:hypothetical protein [Kribbella sp. NBC_01484]
MSLKRTSAVATSALLLGGLAAVQAGTAEATTSAACTMTVGSITSGGDIGSSAITASSPVAAKQSTGVHIFSPGIAKISTTWTRRPKSSSGDLTSGEVLLNTTLYSAWYGTDTTGKPITGLSNAGKNYGGYIVDERTSYLPSGPEMATYRLRSDGVLYRFDHHWTNFPYDTVYHYNGFAAVKTMALISETKTYDTFLANTRAGALYTIHIPKNAALKPVVTKIRTSTWQTFESLVTERCGNQSTLLTAIDKDTGSAYLYAVGHATGASTVIKGLGKVPGTYKDSVYYRHTTEGVAPLNGE